MRRPSETDLLGFILDVLPVEEQQRIAERLNDSPVLRRRLGKLQADLPLEDEPDASWTLPPPGVSGGPWPMRLSIASRPVDPQQLWMEVPAPSPRLPLIFFAPDQEGRQVVVLRRSVDGWQVIAPLDPEERMLLSEIDKTPEGAFSLTLEGTGEGLALALPPADWPVDWESAPALRWRALQEAIRSGEIPVEVLGLP